MSIISGIGRKSWKTRGLYTLIYLLLIGGSLTMVYPFLLMISGSTKSAVDSRYFNVVPRFLYDDGWLYRKHIEGLFNESLATLNRVYSERVSGFDRVGPPQKVNRAMADAFAAFVQSEALPFYTYTIGYLEAPNSKTMPLELRRFKHWLRVRYGDDIAAVNRALDAEFSGWNDVYIRRESYLLRREKPLARPLIKALAEFKSEVPLGLRYYFSLEEFFRKIYLPSEYGGDIAKYNRVHGADYSNYAEIELSRSYPAAARAVTRKDWEGFVRSVIGMQYVGVMPSALAAYRRFLKAKHGSIELLNKNYGTDYKSFDDVPLLPQDSFQGLAAVEWGLFLRGWQSPADAQVYKVPAESLFLRSTDFAFRDWLQQKYGNIARLNSALGASFVSFAAIGLPQRELHWLWFQQHRGELRREFVVRNYITVAEYLLFHGRGLWNTVVYCLLAVLSALLINPLAAYAMSRYKLPSSYKILLFMLCTMAFPPMVTAIPNFLMLRNLGLLNTFAALILPVMANGYAVFLLKGFFDSQPRELYESAALDGAGEWVIFWQITMSLSKPILAVIALQAFNLAYSNFMFAFVVCQDERMWTLMVWLYQLQQKSGQAVMYASLIIAAIPTFIIFIFCQNLIMRGIVVPSEK
jgi:multiple sugar transport system permease protein